MLRGILFDLDDVLIESEEIYFKAVSSTFQRYGIDISRDEYTRRWIIGKTGSSGVINDYGLQVTVQEIRAIRDSQLELYFQDLQMMPKALDLLHRVYGSYPLGLVSSANRKEILKKAGKFDLMKFFKISVSGDEVRKKKPDSEPYLKGCELLGLNPNNVLVIEDNPSGVKSGKDAGCIVIVKPGVFTREMDYSLADKVVESFEQINETMLRELFL